MHLRRRTTQGLAASGALLLVVGLSLGGGVALASSPEPAAAGQPDAMKATSTSSDTTDPSSDKPRKKDRKSKKSTSTTSSDATDSGSTDSGSGPSGSGPSGSSDPDSSDPDSTGPSRSTGSTATTATTTAPSTATTATTVTATTATTRPTTASAPPTTATTSAGSGGSYDGKPISAAEDDDSTTTTIDDGRDTGSPAPARRPAARDGSGSGSDLPPGIYPAGPGGARTANSPAPSSTPAPAQPVMPNPPIVSDTQPAAQTTSSTAANGAAEGTTDPSADSEVRGANQVQEEAPAPVAREARQLGQTGDGTRRLILFGGVALLLGAVAVGFTGRDGPILAAAATLPAGPARRRAKPRRELDGWEDGVPLAPVKRELARQRLGLSADVWYYDDEPGA